MSEPKHRKISLVTVVLILIGSTVLTPGCVSERPFEGSGSKDFAPRNSLYLCSLFDELDSKVNEGKGYSEYLNTEGFPTGALLAWSESYLMQAYAAIYRATGDMKYLDKLHNHIKSVLANRDDRIGKKDYKGEIVPGWGYTIRKGEWMVSAVNTGMITYPMLEFVQLARESDIEKYSVIADSILQQVEESIKYHDTEWKVDYYVYPQDFYNKENYVLPLSQQAAISRSLLLLYELTGREEYSNKTTSIAKSIKGSLQDNGDGYIVGLFPGKITDKNKVVDISHATITIHFAYLVYENDIVFDKEDMYKFTKTIKNLATANNNHFPKYLDGTGNFDYEVAAGQYAFLAEFDSQVYESIIDLFFNHLKIEQTAKYMQEDWWGTVMLALSRLALYQSNFE